MEESQSSEIERLVTLLSEAFDELHQAVVSRANSPATYLSPHSDYPSMQVRDNGFPYFTKQGWIGDQKAGRRDYVGSIRPTGIIAALLGKRAEDLNLKIVPALEEFLRTSSYSSKFFATDSFNAYLLDQIMGGVVERCIHLFGLSPVDNQRKSRLLLPLFKAIVQDDYALRIVVPIALTHFEFDHFQINDATYVTRIPKGLQLARSRIQGGGSGATEGAMEAATHAFVSTGWSMTPDNLYQLSSSLSSPDDNVLDAVDLFFASLRAATGASTGYAQVLMLPKKWATSYYVDLPPVFGRTYRRYPGSFDSDYYQYNHSSVTKKEMNEVRRIYNLVVPLENDRISIALKRLNACMTRDDPLDAILDAAIGLEVLLGQGADAISYKIRMRAAALATLRDDRKPADVLSAVKGVYDFRSKVVHGDTTATRKAKRVQSDGESLFEGQRRVATDMLRFVVDVLVEHPKFLTPESIDLELMLGTGSAGTETLANGDEPTLPGISI